MTDAVKNKVLHMFEQHKIGTLATIRNNKPYSRFMLFFHKDLVLYTATHKDTHKVDDIKYNPHVHILLGDEGKGWNDSYVEIEAEATIVTSEDLKSEFWTDELNEWMSGPDDPNYMLLQFMPTSIRYFEKAGSEPQELGL
jgi:general stress protein 26